MKAGRVTALAALTAPVCLLVACGTSPTNPEVPDLGNAVAASSPAADSPAGETMEFSGEISDMEAAGEVLGLRHGATLTLGTLEELRAGQTHDVDVPDTCADLTATQETFVLACGDEVLLIDAADGTVDSHSVADSDAAPAASAVLTSTGELVVGSAENDRVVVFVEGEEQSSITVAGMTSQLLATAVGGQDDAVVRTNHENTTIQDIHWRDGRQGGTLRVGLGIGQAAVGPEGLVLASDNRGGQLAVYTADNVVRLHQTVPVTNSPWAVAWDVERDLAWITTTADNQLHAFTLATGVPEEVGTIETIEDAHNLVALPDGTLVIASATGGGVQVITDPEL
ncbi:MAG: hypothetical protein Q4G50_06895 [Corynebacterium sp.]|uniref:hypothetical protein n=1 Tax=Corynebacterium sp. TaxID=1720 RepID=UPI0026E0E14A|nr:hypothetical protein [Corynebacterium sp.]MDO5669714.1 hypothetical protein [Corynebacterium sp.]